jgi:type IX secretion system PorP/SprF family membrane protein
MKAKIFIPVLLVITLSVKAQDFHLAQYDAFSLYLNPALTGNYLGAQGDYRVQGVYRTQWRALSPQPYTTYGISYDMPYKRYGFGGFILDNRSGAANFNTLEAQASGAYQITDPATSPHLLSTGVQMGLFYKTYNPSKLLYESQYDYTTSQLNPDISSGEYVNRINRANFDANMGVFYKYRDVKKSYWPFLGVSVYHLNRPKESFMGSSSRLPMHWNIQAGCDFKVNEELKLTPMFLFMTQAGATEYNLGCLGAYKLTGKEATYDILFGANYRIKDALIFQAGIQKDNIILRFSYDVNTSYLRSYTNSKGGFELTFSMIMKKGQPVFSTLSKF